MKIDEVFLPANDLAHIAGAKAGNNVIFYTDNLDVGCNLIWIEYGQNSSSYYLQTLEIFYNRAKIIW